MEVKSTSELQYYNNITYLLYDTKNSELIC